jgi:hypothetical protein
LIDDFLDVVNHAIRVGSHEQAILALPQFADALHEIQDH